MRGHEACNQVVLAAEQGERAGDIHVCGVLHAVTFPAPPVQEHPLAGRRVRVAAAGGRQARVMIADHVAEAELDLPVVGQGLLQ
ncbi:hypothetical protein D3C81_1122260 [compost metagenome]